MVKTVANSGHHSIELAASEDTFESPIRLAHDFFWKNSDFVSPGSEILVQGEDRSSGTWDSRCPTTEIRSPGPVIGSAGESCGTTMPFNLEPLEPEAPGRVTAQGARASAKVRPRFEALETRCLMSGTPLSGSSWRPSLR